MLRAFALTLTIPVNSSGWASKSHVTYKPVGDAFGYFIRNLTIPLRSDLDAVFRLVSSCTILLISHILTEIDSDDDVDPYIRLVKDAKKIQGNQYWSTIEYTMGTGNLVGYLQSHPTDYFT